MRSGDGSAKDRLCAIYMPILQRWAGGQMPRQHRDLVDTADLAQITRLRVLDQIDSFQPRQKCEFLAYLRQALLNAIRDEICRSMVRGGGRSDDIDDV